MKYNRLMLMAKGHKPGYRYYWCDCGNITHQMQCAVIKEKIKSCGCLRKENIKKMHEANTKHGLLIGKNNKDNKFIQDITYNSWQSMKARCLNPDHEKYFRYGGAGIKICDQWINNFNQFKKDMGERPSNEYTIHRKKQDGDYTPDNCEWAKIHKQNRERSGCGIKIEYDGLNLYISEWAEITGLSYECIYRRYKNGLNVHEILNKGSKKCPNPRTHQQYKELILGVIDE